MGLNSGAGALNTGAIGASVGKLHGVWTQVPTVQRISVRPTCKRYYARVSFKGHNHEFLLDCMVVFTVLELILTKFS